MTKTYYIVPAFTDEAGQCRIVACLSDSFKGSARDSYRLSPELWREAGLMNSQGQLVCVDTKEAEAEFKACEPLAAGMQIEVETIGGCSR